MLKLLRFAILLGPFALISACTTNLSDSDRALLTTASQNAATASQNAAAAKEAAERAAAAAEQAAQQARANAQAAQQFASERGLRK